MNAREFAERQDKALDLLCKEGILTPVDPNDPDISAAINKAQEELIKKFYEAD